jgi:hypothetical protein
MVNFGNTIPSCYLKTPSRIHTKLLSSRIRDTKRMVYFGQHKSFVLVKNSQSNPHKALIFKDPGSKKNDEFGQNNSVVLVKNSQPNPHKVLIFKNPGSKKNYEFGQNKSVLLFNHSKSNPQKHNIRTLYFGILSFSYDMFRSFYNNKRTYSVRLLCLVD